MLQIESELDTLMKWMGGRFTPDRKLNAHTALTEEKNGSFTVP